MTLAEILDRFAQSPANAPIISFNLAVVWILLSGLLAGVGWRMFDQPGKGKTGEYTVRMAYFPPFAIAVLAAFWIPRLSGKISRGLRAIGAWIASVARAVWRGAFGRRITPDFRAGDILTVSQNKYYRVLLTVFERGLGVTVGVLKLNDDGIPIQPIYYCTDDEVLRGLFSEANVPFDERERRKSGLTVGQVSERLTKVIRDKVEQQKLSQFLCGEGFYDRKSDPVVPPAPSVPSFPTIVPPAPPAPPTIRFEFPTVGEGSIKDRVHDKTTIVHLTVYKESLWASFGFQARTQYGLADGPVHYCTNLTVISTIFEEAKVPLSITARRQSGLTAAQIHERLMGTLRAWAERNELKRLPVEKLPASAGTKIKNAAEFVAKFGSPKVRVDDQFEAYFDGKTKKRTISKMPPKKPAKKKFVPLLDTKDGKTFGITAKGKKTTKTTKARKARAT